jgi:hypothetical protein
MNDQEIENELQAKGLTAPRVTLEDIENNIIDERYFTAGDGIRGKSYGASMPVPEHLDQITFCVLTLSNGFNVVGVNAGPVSPENFDAQLGRKLARQNAIDQLWPLMGYALRDRLSRGEAA